jgi:hypothetical protein
MPLSTHPLQRYPLLQPCHSDCYLDSWLPSRSALIFLLLFTNTQVNESMHVYEVGEGVDPDVGDDEEASRLSVGSEWVYIGVGDNERVRLLVGLPSESAEDSPERMLQ